MALVKTTPAASDGSVLSRQPPPLRRNPYRTLLMTLVAAGDTGMFSELGSELATDERDVELHAFVDTFRRDHGHLPSAATFHQATGLELQAETAEPVPFLHDRAQTSAVMSRMKEAMLAAADMQTRGTRSEEILARLALAVRECSRVCTPAQATTMQQLFRILEREYARAKGAGGAGWITLGWDKLDEVTGGARGEDLVTLVGYTGMGKSQYLAYMAVRAWLSGKSIVLCTNEMNTVDIGLRLVGHLTGFNPQHLRGGRLGTHAAAQYTQFLRDGLPDMPPFTFLDGEFGLTVSALRANVERLHPDGIYVDASYLMSPDKDKWRTGHETAAQLEGELKQMARDFQRPIIKTVQFSNDYARERKDEQRAAKRREKGQATERDAQRVRKDPTLDTIGASSAVAKHGSIVIAVEEGDGAVARITRRMTLMKAREGETGYQWHVNFGHDPVNCEPFDAREAVPAAISDDWNQDVTASTVSTD